MASPLPTRKTTVDLSKGPARVSRIRRDPPPKPVKELTREEQRRREAWGMAVGITVFAIALVVILFQFALLPSAEEMEPIRLKL